jgi:hypothetical protein
MMELGTFYSLYSLEPWPSGMKPQIVVKVRRPEKGGIMRFEHILGAIAVGLFIGMLICLNIGYWFGRRQLARNPEAAKGGTGTLDAAVFGLLGLILAFSFGGAAARYDARRQLIVEEANAIGTAWLRIDLLPSETRPAIRDRFRRYLDSRLLVYAKLPDLNAAFAELARSEKCSGKSGPRPSKPLGQETICPHR